MRTRYSAVFPIAAILSGVVLGLNTLGITGKFLPNDILLKLWPVLLVFAALDLLFTQRRLVGAVVLLATAGALLSAQFMQGGWTNRFWLLFQKYWPVLLILFGIDNFFAGRSLINSAVIIAGVVILVFILLSALNGPLTEKLPFDLTSITAKLPSIDLTGFLEGTAGFPQPPSSTGTKENRESKPGSSAVVYDSSSGRISAPLLAQGLAELELDAASGRISVKAGNTAGEFLSGTIRLDGGEKLSADADLNGQTGFYTLKSSGGKADNNNSNWDLSLSAQQQAGLNVNVDRGYIKGDLRNLTLRSAKFNNRFGPIDVMIPASMDGLISITAGEGDVRVYIPAGGSIRCVVTGTSEIEYPQRNYMLSGNTVMPRSGLRSPVMVEITSNNGSVRIIESNK